MIRGSGILLPVFSLPSPYGIGTFGKEARHFADFLKSAGQKYWQVLPLGPTSFGDSPYQSFSSYAGNPYYIDLEVLIEEGLLERSFVESFDWGADPRHVDYGKLYENRFPVLKEAMKKGIRKYEGEFDAFCSENSFWLEPYVRFMTLKRKNGMEPWHRWTETEYEENEDTRLFRFIQFLFYRQWTSLKSYINDLGIRIIGDLPIYVAMDSADVWAEPEAFQLKEDGLPKDVSGVPPDYFTEDGQLWGNPLYDYEAMKQSGWSWWIRRIGQQTKLYDVIRLDHFRGFDSYWAVPAEEETARNGRWIKGPGMELVGTLTGWFGNTAFIAEDLGILTEDVRKLLKDSGLPGMKVLEFAFPPGEPSDYQPHRYRTNCVCYTGTHDNAPLGQWLAEAEPEETGRICDYLGISDRTRIAEGILRAGMSSVADTFVSQLQDWLGTGKESRINMPGTLGGNWQWRMLPGTDGPELAESILHMTKLYER